MSPEFAGNLNTKNSRRHSPAVNATMACEKIRFINETHLTIEQTHSGRRTRPRPTFRALPARQVERLHEGTWTNFLRRRARPMASHASSHGDFRSFVDPAPGVFLRQHRRQCGTSGRFASGYQADLSRAETQVQPESCSGPRGAPPPRREPRQSAGEL